MLRTFGSNDLILMKTEVGFDQNGFCAVNSNLFKKANIICNCKAEDDEDIIQVSWEGKLSSVEVEEGEVLVTKEEKVQGRTFSVLLARLDIGGILHLGDNAHSVSYRRVDDQI